MSTVESGTHTVRLAVPAKPEYIVLTRLALSAVCRLTPLQPEDVADLKLAVTEAATALVGEESEEQELGQAIIRATVDECEFRDGSVRLVKYLKQDEQ